MNRPIAWFLAAVSSVAMLSFGTAAAIDLPDAAELARSASAFELRPGVVVDPAGGVAYLMRPGGGIEKVSLTSGELLWTTQEAAKPLALFGDLLIAQVDGTAAADALEIVLLDAQQGGERRQRSVFAKLRDLRDGLHSKGLRMPELSMGMSGDYEAAVAEGATMVRLGTVLFGERRP